MSLSEELEHLIQYSKETEDQARERLIALNRAKSALATIRKCFVGYNGKTMFDQNEIVIDALTVANNPFKSYLWPKHLRPNNEDKQSPSQ